MPAAEQSVPAVSGSAGHSRAIQRQAQPALPDLSTEMTPVPFISSARSAGPCCNRTGRGCGCVSPMFTAKANAGLGGRSGWKPLSRKSCRANLQSDEGSNRFSPGVYQAVHRQSGIIALSSFKIAVKCRARICVPMFSMLSLSFRFGEVAVYSSSFHIVWPNSCAGVEKE